MPWKEVTTMSLRTTFVRQAQVEGANLSQVCRQAGISRKTGYKWLRREREEGVPGLADRSRRPRHSPGQTPPAMEEHVLAVRGQHPAWGWAQDPPSAATGWIWGRAQCQHHHGHLAPL